MTYRMRMGMLLLKIVKYAGERPKGHLISKTFSAFRTHIHKVRAVL